MKLDTEVVSRFCMHQHTHVKGLVVSRGECCLIQRSAILSYIELTCVEALEYLLVNFPYKP